MSTDTREAPNVWRDLYRRAINEANGLTVYVEDRPELHSAERRLEKIEADARRALSSQPAKSDDELLKLRAQVETLKKAAVELLYAVDTRHENVPPLKYTIPYAGVNALRAAIAATKEQQA